MWEASDSVAALERWAQHLADYHPRVMTVDRAIRHAEPHNVDAAAHRSRVDEAQRGSCERLASWLAAEDRLARGWDTTTAADMLFALISCDLMERLLDTCGGNQTQLAGALARLFRSAFTKPAVTDAGPSDTDQVGDAASPEGFPDQQDRYRRGNRTAQREGLP